MHSKRIHCQTCYQLGDAFDSIHKGNFLDAHFWNVSKWCTGGRVLSNFDLITGCQSFLANELHLIEVANLCWTTPSIQIEGIMLINQNVCISEMRILEVVIRQRWHRPMLEEWESLRQKFRLSDRQSNLSKNISAAIAKMEGACTGSSCGIFYACASPTSWKRRSRTEVDYPFLQSTGW